MTDDFINQTYQHVSYGVGLGELGVSGAGNFYSDSFSV